MNLDDFINVQKQKPLPAPQADSAAKSKLAQDGSSSAEAPPPPPATKSRKKKKSLYDKLDLTRFIGHETVIQHVPFVLFIALLALLYIWNNHHAVKSVKTINKNEKEIKQLKWEYLTAKSELEGKSKQSEVARLVEPYSIRELKAPPVKIYVNPEQRN